MYKNKRLTQTFEMILYLLINAAILLSLICPNAEAHVILERTSEYESQPAAFGKQFVPNIIYDARAQYIADDPFLCGVDENGVKSHGLPDRQVDRIVVPPDGLPGT